MPWSTSLRSWLLAHVGMAWPWTVCGLVASLLVGHQREAMAMREHPSRHALELRAHGVRHVRRGDFAATIACEGRSCRVDARVGRSDSSRELSFVADRGRWVAVLEHGSVLLAIDEELAPPYRAASGQSLALAVLVSVLFAAGFLVWAACSHDELLRARGARPCRVTDGTVELLDGNEPSVARTIVPGVVQGPAWAWVVSSAPPTGYRERPLPHAVVFGDRDERILDAAVGRSRALVGLSALTAVWLVTFLGWA